MKKKNGIKVAHWILLGLSTVLVAVGAYVCIKVPLKPSELIPSIISFCTLVATIVIDMVGNKKEKAKSIDIENQKAKDGSKVTTKITGATESKTGLVVKDQTAENNSEISTAIIYK